MQIWDDKEVLSLSSSYRGGLIAMIVFDVTSRESFVNSVAHFKEAMERTKECNAVIAGIGTKSDLEELRTVSFEEATEFFRDLGIQYFETSSRTGDNVDNCFMTVVQQAVAIVTR